MHLDPVLLARLQFAFTISFHIIFPTFTIGIAIYLATLEVLWGWTGAERYKRLAALWTRIFAVSFAMGVVSGVVLSYQIGTNWSRFSAVAGNVIGPLLGYEVLTAFFLEASFLGILLFGGDRVPRWLHVFSALMVAFGTTMSAFWILSANSWMQTPVGYTMADGIVYPANWWAIIFNPSFPYRLAHMLNASLLTGGFVGIAVGARYLLANRHAEEARTMLRMAIGPLHLREMLPATLKICVATAAMVVVAWGLQVALGQVALFSTGHFSGLLLTVIVVGAIAVAVYLGGVLLLKVEEVSLLKTVIMAKLGRR